MATSFPMANPWVDNEQVNAAKMLARITTPLNDLAALVAAGPQGLLSQAFGGVSRTLTTAGTWYVSTGQTLTLSLATQRRVRVVCIATVTPANSTVGQYQLRGAYQSGASIDNTNSTLIAGVAPQLPSGGNTNPFTLNWESSVLLAAGQWTFAAMVNRLSGGSSSDQVSAAYVAVYDSGSS